MDRDVRVHLLPDGCDPESLRGGVAVILDILRASTTIVHALAAGATEVVPCLDVDEARQKFAAFSPGTAVLGGERHGLLIPGFDLDNNPFAYTPATVGLKTVIFTTSNGTRALDRARQSDRILIGSFVNLGAVVRELSRESRPIHLICAGTNGQVSGEDVLCAGAIADRLMSTETAATDDSLRLARAFFQQESQRVGLPAALRASLGGRNCVRLGFGEQVDRAATCDLFDDVPEYNAVRGTITRRGLAT